MTQQSSLQLNIEKCPVCDSAHIAPLDLRETYFIRNLDRRLTIEFGACARCGFSFQLNPLTPGAFEKYYEDNSQLRITALNVVEEFVHSQQAAFIASVTRLEGARVLEIGSSTGKFLDFLKLVHGAETYFDEKNIESRQHLTAVGGHRPIEERPEQSAVDVVVLRHILEHVPEPLAWVGAFKRYVRPGGWIFIEVPDWSFVDDQTNLVAFEHVNHFSQHTLSHLLFRAGYIVVKQEMSITKGYATSGGDRVVRVLATPFPGNLANGVEQALKDHHYKRVGRILALVERLVRDANHAGKKVAFYGASWGSERVFLNTSVGPENVVCIFDKDKRKQEALYYDVPVYDPSRITEVSPDILFVFTSHAPAVKRDLQALGFKGQVLSRSELETYETQAPLRP